MWEAICPQTTTLKGCGWDVKPRGSTREGKLEFSGSTRHHVDPASDVRPTTKEEHMCAQAESPSATVTAPDPLSAPFPPIFRDCTTVEKTAVRAPSRSCP